MVRSRWWVLVVPAVVVTGCSRGSYAEGLEAPPTEGVPTEGPGSGDTLAAQLHYTLQTNNPDTWFDDPSCPDVARAEPGATVTCKMTVGEGEQERQSFRLTMDDEGIWQISDG